MNAKTKKSKRPRKPVYVLKKRMIDPDTGEEVAAFVPSSALDRAILNSRKYRNGQLLRAIITAKGNYKFFKLAHALGALAVEHCEGFEKFIMPNGKPDGHEALKQLQKDSGVCCEEFDIDLGPLGVVKAKQARSIAYDEMQPDDFSNLVHGVCQYLQDKFAGIPPGEIAEIIAKVTEGNS